MNEAILDQKKSEEFAQGLLQTVNSGALALMISVGHRTGLFDAMAAAGAPASSDEIAGAAGLQERYVREWLAAMTTGRVVCYDPASEKYELPREHAAWLTRQSAPNNISITTQWISVLASVEDNIVECFQKGGGVPYEKFHRFHQVMAEESHQTVVIPLLDKILPLIPEGAEKLKKGIRAADIGCGSGKALILLAKTFPESEFTGYDFFEEAVRNARAHAAAEGVKNIRFVREDAAALEARESFDLIFTFDAIHDQKEPAKVLKNIHRALKAGGTYLMQEIAGASFLEKNMAHPVAPLLYTISCMHCMSVSLAQDGAGLGNMWGRETALEMLHQTGFQEIRVERLDHDFINDYYVMNKT